MQSDREDAFSPLDVNFNDYVNDTESLHMFNADSPGVNQISIDPASVFLNNDFAASPVLGNSQPGFSPSRFVRGPVDEVKQEQAPFSQSPLHPRSALSSASPESSSHDSSSDSSGRRKRKSPDSSSPSTLFGSHAPQPGWRHDGAAAAKMGVDSKARKLSGSPLDADKKKHNPELDLNMQFINSEMQNNLDFRSAASSPKGFASAAPLANTSALSRHVPRSAADQTMSTLPMNKSVFTFGVPSRDNSPPSATFAATQHTSPSTLQNDYSLFPDPLWSGMTPGYGMDAAFMASPQSTATNAAMTINPSEVGHMGSNLPLNSKLHVNKIPPKSRVETQISIKLTLDPLPPGVTKLHLPTQSISKAKLLAKDAERAPDTLELTAMLVCTSAMQNHDHKARALRVARGEEVLPPGEADRRASNGLSKKEQDSPVDPNDPTLPQNGGEVKICDNCINRERKRAARKKQRKQEEEDIWNSYERDRVIVFNTAEYQNFHPPTPLKEESPDTVASFTPDAMQIDAPMRIACYCRHMNEKVGFQVIFTVKDFQGRFVAQTMTQSIHITDDHKTHGPGINSSQDFGFGEQQQYNMHEIIRADPSALFHGNLPHRQYHSTTDLAALERNIAAQAQFGGPFGNGTGAVVQGPGSTSGVSHQRTLSRPASPSAQTGPKKKRKGSAGQHKLPANLVMTRADPQPPMSIADMSSAMAATSASFSPENIPFSAGADGAFALPPGSAIQQPFNAGPPTPNSALNMFTNANRSGSAENLPFFYSAPNSAHPSRAASPVSFSRPLNAPFATQQTVAGPSTTPFGGLQIGPEPQQQPVIHKILPGEGPVTGGIEVTCLGKNFHRGLEVMFGDNVATTTTHWGDSTLVCLLPQSAISGPVSVTFAHQQQPSYSPPNVTSPAVYFTYNDDRDRQLFETCIRIMSTKQNGPGQDPRTFAQQIIQDAMTGTATPYSAAQSSGYAGNVMSAVNKEEVMLVMLEKIDMDDSPHDPNFDLRTSSGQTMLTLACALGYHRLVSGLLARGADPDLADIAGYTPLMVAALHNHAQIVRRLILKGADYSKRNLRGFTASDLATASEVASELRQVRHHLRSISADAPVLRSRASSAASTRSLWGPPSSNASSSIFTTEDESAVDSDDERDHVPQVAVVPALRSRRNSGTIAYSRRGSATSPLPGLLAPPVTDAVVTTAPPNTPYAIMAVWRENLAAQIQLFQQNAVWAMPNIQLPNLPPLDLEQNFPSWRRLSSLVPNRPTFLSGSTPPEEADGDHEGSDWPGSDSTAAPPPAYGDIFPENANVPFDTKPPEVSVATEATTAPTSGESAQASGSSAHTAPATEEKEAPPQRPPPARKTTLRIGKNTSEEQVAQFRQLRKETLTSARDDRNLWYRWFPLLVILAIWWYSGLNFPPVFSWAGSGLKMVQQRFRPTGAVVEEIVG